MVKAEGMGNKCGPKTGRIVTQGLPTNSARACWDSGYHGGLDYTYGLRLLVFP